MKAAIFSFLIPLMLVTRGFHHGRGIQRARLLSLRTHDHRKPLAELYPESFDLLSIIDPVGTAQVRYPRFLPEYWPPAADIDQTSYALIYEFTKERADAFAEYDDDDEDGRRHVTLCTEHAAHLVRTLDVPMIDGRRGKVLLWAAYDAEALRREVLHFIVRDPLVVGEHVGHWVLVPRNELIAYIKDWWIITKSYKTLLGEVERLDRIALARKPFTQQRRRMTVEDKELFNSGLDAPEYEENSDGGNFYEWKNGRPVRRTSA